MMTSNMDVFDVALDGVALDDHLDECDATELAHLAASLPLAPLTLHSRDLSDLVAATGAAQEHTTLLHDGGKADLYDLYSSDFEFAPLPSPMPISFPDSSPPPCTVADRATIASSSPVAFDRAQQGGDRDADGDEPSAKRARVAGRSSSTPSTASRVRVPLMAILAASAARNTSPARCDVTLEVPPQPPPPQPPPTQQELAACVSGAWACAWEEEEEEDTLSIASAPAVLVGGIVATTTAAAVACGDALHCSHAQPWARPRTQPASPIGLHTHSSPPSCMHAPPMDECARQCRITAATATMHSQHPALALSPPPAMPVATATAPPPMSTHRAYAIHRYLWKRARRKWDQDVTYSVRRTLALQRGRRNGRFAANAPVHWLTAPALDELSSSARTDAAAAYSGSS